MKKTDRELLKDALFVIESGLRGGEAHDITEEIRARLAKPPKLEPRAWVASESSDGKDDALYWNSRDAEEDGYALIEPLYSHPQRRLDRLSDEEILAIVENYAAPDRQDTAEIGLDGEPTGEFYPLTLWAFCSEELTAFARELLEKAK